MTIYIENPPDGLPKIANLKQDEKTQILWKLRPVKKGEKIDSICSHARCKKEITLDENGVILEDDQTDLIAYFHVECFRSILQKECLNNHGGITYKDVGKKGKGRKPYIGKR